MKLYIYLYIIDSSKLGLTNTFNFINLLIKFKILLPTTFLDKRRD